MKKFLTRCITALLFCTLMMQSTVFANSNQQFSDEKLSELNNSKIEKIIEKNETVENKCISYLEEEKFLNNATEINALENMSEEQIEEYFSYCYCGGAAANTSSAGVITNPLTYLHKNVGKSTDTYTLKTVTLSGVTKTTCSSLDNGNNCTLTALYNIMSYYRAKGYSKIPTSNSTLYSKIKKEATSLGYTASDGLTVTKNNNLVKNTWRNGFGYSSGNGSNNYLWTATSATKSIDNGKPFMFSLASGYYYDHTVAVYGYRVYTNNRTGKSYTFLQIADGWSSTARFLAWTNTGESYVACMTSITAP